MKPPTKMVRTVLSTTFDVLQTEMYKLAYNAACDEWLKWHEELRLALGAQPGDDLIEYASNKGWKITIDKFYANPHQRNDVLAERDKEIDSLRAEIAERDFDATQRYIALLSEIDSLRAEIAERDDIVEKFRDISNVRLGELERLRALLDEKDEMLNTAAKSIRLQRDAMALLLESVKAEKGEPDES